MSDSIPLHQATDDEVFDALLNHVVAPLREEWKKASAETEMVIKGGAAKGLDAESLKAHISPLWRGVWQKIGSADYVIGHLKERVTRARACGILPGDPREADLFRPKM
jgi:hypothetical protein